MSGCAPPLEIQVWSACERTQNLYPFPADEEARLRGVDAAFYENFRRLELYSGRVTIVIFGDSRGELLKAAAALRGLNTATPTSQPLPAAAAVHRAGGC